MDTESLHAQLNSLSSLWTSRGVRLFCQEACSAKGTIWHILIDDVVPYQVQVDLTNAKSVVSRAYKKCNGTAVLSYGYWILDYNYVKSI